MADRGSRLVPAPADIVFLVVAFASAVILGSQALNTDGDLGRHLRVGRDILAHGLFRTDHLSLTMAGKPFVPYEWGSEVLYALAHRAAGLPGVLVLMGVTLAATYFFLTVLLQHLRLDPLLAFGTAASAALLSSMHWIARPHVFSLLGVVGVMALLEVTGRESGVARPVTRDPRLLLTLALFAIWANLHGGFLFGLVLISFYAVGDVVALTLDRDRPPHIKSLRSHSMLLLAALVGCSVNPSGPMVLPHVAGYLGKTWLVDITAEYKSPDFHQWYGREFLIFLSLAIAGLAVVRRRMSWAHLVSFLGTTAFALHSVRNVPLWGLTGFTLVALHVNDSWQRLQWRPLVRLRSAFTQGASLARPGFWTALTIIGLGIAALNGGRAGSARILADRFDPAFFPVQVVERARAEHVNGRLFNEFTWGGYILNMWPEQTVFIDGQTDFYGVALSQLYMQLRQAEPGAESKLDSMAIDVVLLPEEAPLSRELLRSNVWMIADSADGAVRFKRRSSPASTRRPPQRSAPASKAPLREGPAMPPASQARHARPSVQMHVPASRRDPA